MAKLQARKVQIETAFKERVVYSIYTIGLNTRLQTFEEVEVSKLPNLVEGMLRKMYSRRYILFYNEETRFDKNMSIEDLDKELSKYGFTIKKEILTGYGYNNVRKP